MKALTQYLSTYAEPETQQLSSFPTQYSQAVVIPFYREPPVSLQRFCNLAADQGRCLLVVVINRPQSDSDTQWAQQLLTGPPVRQGKTLWQSTDSLLRLIELENQSGLLLVDRCLHGLAIDDEYGVGLARKIGADIVCQLMADTKVSSPWIANTDADAILPQTYFSSLQQQSSTAAALVFPYQHIFIDDTPKLPTILYEFSLHYYVAGLQWAGSPYAYQTLGSTIAIHYQHYAMVRGFPKRAGAEDFYLLSKLAKTGAIVSLKQPSIDLQARESTRVPFGTGPAVINLAASEQPLTMPLYHPDSFSYLRYFLELLEQLAQQPVDIQQAVEQLAPPESLDSDLLLRISDQLSISKALEHCYKQGKTPAIRLQHLQHWFDGFKTLKFIHLLRDQGLEEVSYLRWLEGGYAFSGNKRMAELSLRVKELSGLGLG
ncbi:hypothetical protein [Oceanicoccus sagamiensis]|uniref:Glycosyltransferase 2-like domain-containing protein n=1 Tax=Oceanicoccus sagamiensis TaxID=716816 RepID=A0A1X9NA80_9GAMM|nr:hypothetical protein [Oceanicoccus sagamiensis]ARN74960.1 hypothetical protein BST96_13045 [Oceanicoccus sagamiensis]